MIYLIVAILKKIQTVLLKRPSETICPICTIAQPKLPQQTADTVTNNPYCGGNTTQGRLKIFQTASTSFSQNKSQAKIRSGYPPICA